MSVAEEQVAFSCPHCQAPITHPLSATSELTCPECTQDVTLRIEGIQPATRQIQHCVRCGSELLYVQKDFNRNLGIAIVIVGAVLSFWTYGISLAVAAAVDFVLYQILGDVTVCYRCEAIHRGFAENPLHSAYDIHVAEQFEKGY